MGEHQRRRLLAEDVLDGVGFHERLEFGGQHGYAAGIAFVHDFFKGGFLFQCCFGNGLHRAGGWPDNRRLRRGRGYGLVGNGGNGRDAGEINRGQVVHARVGRWFLVEVKRGLGEGARRLRLGGQCSRVGHFVVAGAETGLVEALNDFVQRFDELGGGRQHVAHVEHRRRVGHHVGLTQYPAQNLLHIHGR